jgi:phosphoadenosine phosphosulfate reductase
MIEELKKESEHLDTKEFLKYFLEKFGNKIALSSSLGAEDQVLTHMLYEITKDARVFTLDTGRLPYETYDVIDETNLKYGVKIELFFPSNESVEKLVNEKGINSFYENIENRKECCNIRKIEPLKRALKTLDVWITGLRSSQAVTRDKMQRVEFDEHFGIIKINPLIDWSEDDVWDYIKKNSIPYNKLHDQNFPSIGCKPCTRAVKDGEDIRAGRWWWESPEHKECGLHKGEDTDVN